MSSSCRDPMSQKVLHDQTHTLAAQKKELLVLTEVCTLLILWSKGVPSLETADGR